MIFHRSLPAIVSACFTCLAIPSEPAAMDNLLPNGGFEHTTDGITPDAWTYTGPPEQASNAWSSDASEGMRAIRLAAGAEAEQWTSDRLPLRGGERYRLEFQTRLTGREPWHWSTHADFVGVRIAWFDHAGDRCGIYERRTRAIGTEGWVRAWLRLDPPAETASCEIAFVRNGGIETDGVFEVDDVRLIRATTRVPEGWGLLRGVVTDSNGGGYARVVATGSDGVRYWPDEDYRRLDGSFHALGDAFEVALPEGPAEIVVMRGFGTAPIHRKVDIHAGETVESRFDLQTFLSMPERGWYGGDAHIHLFFHRHTRHPQMTPADVMSIARAEGMQWLSFKGEEKEARAFIDNPVGWDEDGFIGEIGIESVSDFNGHVYTINARSVPSGGFPMKLVPWPMNYDTNKDLERTGGAIGFAHPHDDLRPDSTLADLANPASLLAAREWPVDVALGQGGPFDVLCSDGVGDTESKLRDYERMLSAGFRVGVCGSTDAYVDQGTLQPGAARTYAYADTLSWDGVASAFRRGATIATNGPLLLLSVDGARAGDEVTSDGSIEVTVEAVSALGLDRVEIVWNGTVVRTFEASTTEILEKTVELDVPASGWITARAYGPVSELAETSFLPAQWVERGIGQFACTSAVYVLRDDAPIAPDPEAARYFVDWIDAYETAIENRADLFQNANGTWGEDVRRAMLDRLHTARAIYADRAKPHTP